VLTIGDAGDYSVSDTLQFNQAAHYDSRFYIFNGGELYMYGDATLDTGITGKSMYAYFYGKSVIQGDAAYRPQLNITYSIYFYFTSTNPTYYTHDIHQWDKLDITGNGGNTLYYVTMVWTPESCYITNFTLDAGGGTGIRSDNYSGEGHHILLQDGTITNCTYGILRYGTRDFVLDNVAIASASTRCIYQASYRPPEYHEGAGQIAGRIAGVEGQVFELLQNCTLTGGPYGLYGLAGMTVLEGCTFSGSTYGIYCSYYSRVYLRTGNSIGGTTPLLGANYSLIAYVFGLTLTVLDAAGSPIEDAQVQIKQKDGKELLSLRTGSDGKPVTHPLMSGEVLLVHKEWISGDPVTGVFEFWSDISNNTWHTVSISKPGYAKRQFDVVMDQNRVIQVRLVDLTFGELPAV